MQLFKLFSLTLYLSITVAQDYPIPTHWVNTTSSLSVAERSQLSQALLDTLSPLFDNSRGLIPDLHSGQNANLDSAIAIYDSMVQPRKNQAVLSDRIHKISASFHSVNVTSVPLMWGLSAIYAYRTYNDQQFLMIATEIWKRIYPWMITPEDAGNGTHPKKNGQLASGCNGASLAGGIFYRKDSMSKGNLSVTAGTEGAFMALSAYLYTSTRGQEYLIAADLAHQFIQSQLYNSEQGFVMDAINLASCNRTTSALTYNTGLYLEALSVLGMATGNSTLIQLANQLAANAVKSPWVTGNGIIVEGSTDVTQDHSDMTYKGILVRALYEHWNQSPRGSSIANLIESFLLVQYNAVLNDARAPNTSWYSPSWNGPPVSQLLPWGQLAAIDILNAAIGLGLVDSPTTSSSINSQPSGISTQPTTSPSQKRPVGAIVGGTLGGFFFLAILGIIIVVVSRRRRRRIQTPKKDSDVCSLDNERPNPETSKINDHVEPSRVLPTIVPSETDYTISSGPYNDFQWSQALISDNPMNNRTIDH